MYKLKLYFLIIALISGFNSSKGQTAADSLSEVIYAVKIDEPIDITGRMDNPEWMKARPVELKYEVSPGDNTPSVQRTLARVLYDQNYLYFGFQCFDTNPELIRANISDRDKIFQDDFVIVGIDTYGDFQKSYELAVNPYGIQGDLLATINGEDASVDWIWYSAAAKDNSGWTAEMKIPFTSLNFPNQNEQTWRLNIVRCISRTSRIQNSWMPIKRNIPGVMPQAGYLKGIRNVKSGGSFEFLPYAMGQKSGELLDNNDPNSSFKYDKIQARIGGSIKYSPSTNFAFDAVMNPDFSQIESDAGQISVNTTFALTYAEKRPFFLIGRDLLQSSMYYSRSINDPATAARIIGKSGGLSYLFMNAYDRHTVIDVPGEEGSNVVQTNMKSMANIGRLRYDLGNETYIGGLVMTRDLSGGHNYLYGLDWNYKFWSNWYFNGEGDFSTTKELNDTSIFSSTREFGKTGFNSAFNGEDYHGSGIHLNLYHKSTNYYLSVTANNYSPAFQTYNGIFDRVGYSEYFMTHEYDYYPVNSFINNGGFGLTSELRYNFYGSFKSKYLQPYFFVNLKGQTNIYIQLLFNDENFHDIWFKGIRQYYFSLNSYPSNEISINASLQLGKFIYREDNPSMGKGHNINLDILLKPTSRVNLEFSYSRARLLSTITNELYYDGNIYRGVGIYQFNTEIFFRTILQYDSFSKSFQIYPLLSYKMNAFTTFFAGATSNYSRYKGSFGMVNTSRQYFIKIQYLVGI